MRARTARARSRRSRRRSSRAPGCRRSPGPRPRVLDASVALIDRSSTVLAVAAASAAEEEKLLASAPDVGAVELRVADAAVGELRYRRRGGADGSPAGLRMVTTLLGLEVERARVAGLGERRGGGRLRPRRARARARRPRRDHRPRRRARQRPRRRRGRRDRAGDAAHDPDRRLAAADPDADAPRRPIRLERRPGGDDRRGGGGEVAVLLPAAEPEPIERAAGAVEDELAAPCRGSRSPSASAATPATRSSSTGPARRR